MTEEILEKLKTDFPSLFFTITKSPTTIRPEIYKINFNDLELFYDFSIKVDEESRYFNIKSRIEFMLKEKEDAKLKAEQEPCPKTK